jgi:hypothetical protein
MDTSSPVYYFKNWERRRIGGGCVRGLVQGISG